jgi:hypothetical protein
MSEQETAGRQPEWALMYALHDALRRDLGAPRPTRPRTMASKQSEAVRELYAGWTQTRLNSEEQDNEHWGDLTRDPGGVDYIETGADGVPAMWVNCADSPHQSGVIFGAVTGPSTPGSPRTWPRCCQQRTAAAQWRWALRRSGPSTTV